MDPIRLLIVDDHSLFRESLGRLLDATPDLRVAAQCATTAEALEALSRLDVDVILLDYDLGTEAGMNLLQQLGQNTVTAKVLMVTAGLSDELALSVMESGAAGIFLKHSSPAQLITAIRQIAAGETWLDKLALQGLVSGRRSRIGACASAHPLTPKQSAVLRGILDGLANKEIAWKLDMSESSVKSVIQELFRKAGVRTRSQLVRIAIEKHTADWLTTRPED